MQYSKFLKHQYRIVKEDVLNKEEDTKEGSYN